MDHSKNKVFALLMLPTKYSINLIYSSYSEVARLDTCQFIKYGLSWTVALWDWVTGLLPKCPIQFNLNDRNSLSRDGHKGPNRRICIDHPVSGPPWDALPYLQFRTGEIN